MIWLLKRGLLLNILFPEYECSTLYFAWQKYIDGAV